MKKSNALIAALLALGISYGISFENKKAVNKPLIAETVTVEKQLEGAGTEENPYLVTSASDFNLLASNVSKGFTYENCVIKLTKDISVGDDNYLPVGTVIATESPSVPGVYNKTEYPFKGVFDGYTHKITLTANYAEDSQGNVVAGLFGLLDDARIYNLNLGGSLFIVDDACFKYVGSVVGKMTNSTIYNVKSTVRLDVMGEFVGGLVGGLFANDGDCEIKSCSYAGSLTYGPHNNREDKGVGAIAGMAGDDITFENVLSRGTVTVKEGFDKVVPSAILGESLGTNLTMKKMLCYSTLNDAGAGCYGLVGYFTQENGADLDAFTYDMIFSKFSNIVFEIEDRVLKTVTPFPEANFEDSAKLGNLNSRLEAGEVSYKWDNGLVMESHAHQYDKFRKCKYCDAKEEIYFSETYVDDLWPEYCNWHFDGENDLINVTYVSCAGEYLSETPCFKDDQIGASASDTIWCVTSISYDSKINTARITLQQSHYSKGVLGKVDGEPSTCSTAGFKDYYMCSRQYCGACFEDENGMTPISDIEEWKLTTGALPLDDTNHNWAEEINFQVSGDSCTATKICLGNSEHNITETVIGEFVEDIPATCETPQLGHYKFTFVEHYDIFGEYSSPLYLSTGEAALGHDFSGTVDYTVVGNTCTASTTCTRDGCGHQISEEDTGEYIEDTPADCTHASTGHYHFEFSSYPEIFATYDTPTNSIISGNELGHDWSEVTYTFDKENKTWTASRTCGNDASHNESETVDAVKENGMWVGHFTNFAFATQSIKAGLGGGAIAGIVIGSFLFVVIAAYVTLNILYNANGFLVPAVGHFLVPAFKFTNETCSTIANFVKGLFAKKKNEEK